MILGFDISPTYPYIAILSVLLIPFVLWRLLHDVGNSASVLKNVIKQIGTNGDSTLRTELTGLGMRIDQLQELIVKQQGVDQQAADKLVLSLQAQDRAIARLDGLIQTLGDTMGKMGIDQQVRAILETQKKIAETTLNVIQAGAAQLGRSGGVDVSGGAVEVGKDFVAGSSALHTGDTVTIKKTVPPKGE